MPIAAADLQLVEAALEAELAYVVDVIVLHVANLPIAAVWIIDVAV
jgi:hypothetical protein